MTNRLSSTSTLCPFHQTNSWKKSTFKIEITKKPPPHFVQSFSFLESFSNHCQSVWSTAVNTYQAIFHLGSFEFSKMQLSHGLNEGHYREAVPHNSLIRDTYIITDPSIQAAILKHHKNGGENGLFNRGLNVKIIAAITGDHNLMTSSIEEHDKLRAFLNPYFEFSEVREYIPHFQKHALNYADRFAKEGSVNVTHEMHKFGLEILSTHLLGFHESTNDIQKAIDTIAEIGVKNGLWPASIKCIDNLLWNSDERLKQAFSTINSAVKNVYHHHKANNLLSDMQQAVDENGDPLFSEEQIIDTVKLLILAGQETSASLLTYILYQLGLNEDLQNELRSEIKELIKTEGFEHCVINSHSLQNLFKEGLRLNPPAQVLSRTLVQNAILINEETQEALFLDKGKTLNCDNYHTQRDFRRWGVDAEKFDPLRHSESTIEQEKGEWHAFGAGPGRCLGRQFATLEVKATLAVLITNLEWTSITHPVKQTGHFTCKIEADHQQGLFVKFIQKLSGTTPSSDIFIQFKALSN